VKILMLMKTELLGYRMVKKYDDMLSRFHLIAKRYGQTDGRTDGNIARRMLTRDKNRSMPTTVIPMATFTCPGRAGLVFRLDRIIGLLYVKKTMRIR